MSPYRRDVFGMVDAYVHGLLAPLDAEFVERRCQASAVWRAALDEARERQELLRSVPGSEASEALIQRTLRTIEVHESGRRRRRRLVWRPLLCAVAASVAVVGALHLYYLNLSPTPYDLRVFGQTDLIADTMAAVRVQLYDHQRARGVTDVPVEIDLRDQRADRTVRLASFRTAAGGSERARFRLPDWADGEYELRVAARVGWKTEEVVRTVKLKRSWRLMLSTDKPVYQPGQTIQCRSLALRKPDLKPLAGQDVRFSITDPKGNIILRRQDVTSRFGIAALDCPLATEIIEGPYTVEATVGDTTSRVAVEVKPYTLPKFRVAVDVEAPFYAPGQMVRGAVQADYYFGQPVAGARVRIEARSTIVAEETLHALEVETDASGRADFAFILPDRLVGREQTGGDASLALVAEVVDSAGQKVSKRVTRPVTTQPLRIEAIPEGGTLVRGVPNTVYLLARYADGRPAAGARIIVSGFAQEFTTDELGVATVEVTPTAAAGVVRWTVRAADSAGRTGCRDVTLKSGAATHDFLVRTDKAVYSGGETVRIVVLGGGTMPVFVDVLKDGQTLLTETVEVTEGRGEYAFDLPADVFGTLEVAAYRLSEGGLPLRKSLVLYVEQAGALTVESRLDQDEYRPGEEARLVVSVRDKEGRPVPGAVSLAAVDEAVFGVGADRPGMESAFFEQEQELLEPIYALYSWMPDLARSESDDARCRLERALFAHAGQVHGARTPCREDVLQALLDSGEITPRQLQVLADPNLERLLERASVSPRLRELLTQGGFHSLTATTYPGKYQAISVVKVHRLRLMKQVWMGVGLVLGIGGYVALCVVARNWALVVTPLVLLLVGYMLLPSLSRARELSKRLVASSNLRGLDTALQVFESEQGDGAPDAAETTGAAAPVWVREWFPETLLWRPELITDDEGRVTVDVPLADSITTWRLSASAVSAEGSLGASTTPIRVFQSFFVDVNLPVALTRGDEITLPVVVYNYLDRAQTVQLELEGAGWFEPLEGLEKQVELGAGEVRSVGYQLRARQVGRHTLTVTARGSDLADAVKREIEVVPDGRHVASVFNGALVEPARIGLDLVPEAIEGSAQAILKLYPSSFSQLVEGLEGIFQRPFGCFEQTSSITYPNVLALDYLRQSGQSVPQVETKAREYIHLGYQRLLGFEVNGGGFDWFGRTPANRTLTAYGLMEFADMAKVHEIDPQLIARTRAWLRAQRNAGGSWSAETRRMHWDPTQAGPSADLTTTAYIAWALYSSGEDPSDGMATRRYLLAHASETLAEPYQLALVCNALLALDPSGVAARPYLARLDGLRRVSADGKLVWWDLGPSARTSFYGSGRSGSVETTALAALAMIRAEVSPGSVRGALTWLSQERDARGTWNSTQATVLALKALLAGSGRPLGGEGDRRIEVTLDDQVIRTVDIPAEQAEVMQQIDLSGRIHSGQNRLALCDRSGGATRYQLTFGYNVPDVPADRPAEALAIDVVYDTAEVAVGGTITATATVMNNMPTAAPMVILDLPIPAGFAIEAESLAEYVQSGAIAKYQLNPRSAVVYLRGLPPGEPLVLQYRLTATMPVTVTAPPARAYEYYNPDVEGRSRPVLLRAGQRT